MSSSIGGVTVSVIDDTSRFQTSYRTLANQVEQNSRRASAALDGTSAAMGRLNQSSRSFDNSAFSSLSRSALRAKNDVEGLKSLLLTLPALAGGFGGALATQQLVQRADAYTNLKNRIASVVEDTRGQISAERDLFDVAQRTRTALQSNAALFSRLKSSSSELSADPSKLLRVVETVQKSFNIGGSTTAEAQSSALQLSQALGSGRLQGDELRSILENNIPLAKLIAKEFGVGVGKLKELGSEGQLTTDRVIKAILAGSDEIDATFKRLKPTIESSLTVLSNGLTRSIGKFDEATGASTKLATGIIGIAGSMDAVVIAAAAAGASLAFLGAGRKIGGAKQSFDESSKARKDAQAKQIADLRTEAASKKEGVQGLIAKQRDARDKAIDAETNALKKLDSQIQQNAKNQIQAMDRIDARRDAGKTFTRPQNDLERLRAQAGSLERDRVQVNNSLSAVSSKGQFGITPEITQSLQEYRIATQNLSDAKLANAKASSVMGTALRGVAAGASYATNFLGGPLGVAITAIGIAFSVATGRAAQFEARVKAATESADAAISKTSDPKKFLDSFRGKSGIEAVLETQAEVTKRLQEQSKISLGLGDKIGKGFFGNKDVQPLLGRQGVDFSDFSKGIGQQIAELPTEKLKGFLISLNQAAIADPAGFQKKNQDIIEQTQRLIALRDATDLYRGALDLVKDSNAGVFTERSAEAGTAKAAEISRYSQAITDAKSVAEAAKPALSAVASALTETLTESARTDGVGAGQIALLGTEAQKSLVAMTELRTAAGSINAPGLVDLVNQFGTGAISLQQFSDGLKAIEGSSSGLSTVRSSLEETAKTADSGRSRVQSLGDAIQSLTGKTVVITVLEKFKRVLGGEDDRPSSGGASAEDAQENRRFAAVAARDARSIKEAEFRKALSDSQLDKRTYGINQLRDKYGGVASDADLAKLYDGENPGRGGGRKKGGGRGFTPGQSFDNKVDLIRQEGRASFFSDLDRQLISQLKEIKSDPKLAERTVNAIRAREPLPERAQQLRDANELKRSGELARDARDQYGALADVLPLVAERRRILSIAVANGDITDQTAAKAVEAYANSFGSLQKINTIADSVSSSLESLFSSVIEKPKKAGEALKKFSLDLLKIGQQQFLFEPLKNSLRSLFQTAAQGSQGSGLGGILGGLFGSGGGSGPILPGGIFSTGLGGGTGLSLTGGLAFHTGGIVGLGGSPRAVPSGVFANAPRYHSGLKTNEFAAILERGEAVATGQQQAGIAKMLKGGEGLPAASVATTNNYIDARGADSGVVARMQAAMKEQERRFGRNVNTVVATGNKRKVFS